MTIPALVLTLAVSMGTPEVYVLRIAENAWDVSVEDVNGDGAGDVHVLTCDERSYPLKKAVAVFPADEKGAYGLEPSVVLPLPPAAGALFFAETDGEPPRELVVAEAAGAQVYRFEAGAYDLVGETAFTSLLPNGAKEPLFLKKGAVDLDEDGIEEWLIPAATGIEIHHLAGLVCSVNCDVVSEVRREDSTYIYHRLPAFHLFTREGEAGKGLAFLSDEFADFAYGENWQERERFRIPVNLEEKWDASSKMADVNNDGFPDLVITQMRGTVNLEALTHVYVAEAPFVYPEEPTATFGVKGAITSPFLVDVDSDGYVDVVQIGIPFGVKNVINFFLRGKVSVDASVYLFNGEDFGKGPAFRTGLTMDAPEGREQVAYCMEDFSGDGRMDVAYGKEDEVLVVHTGEEGRFVSAKPWAKLDLPSFGLARPFDLNGNSAKDIVLFHPGGDNAKRVEAIVF